LFLDVKSGFSFSEASAEVCEPWAFVFVKHDFAMLFLSLGIEIFDNDRQRHRLIAEFVLRKAAAARW